MKVHIGKYKNWWGPYQVADLLRYVGVTAERCDVIGEWLSRTPIATFLAWVYGNRQRKIEITIDDFDSWSADHTMSLIIHPLLISLKEKMNGGKLVDDDDVPENIRSTAAAPKESEWDTDEFFFDRWDWVLDEMIWAFAQIASDGEWEDQYVVRAEEINRDAGKRDDGTTELVWQVEPIIDFEGMKKHQDRINNGLRLFGKYYQGLWW